MGEEWATLALKTSALSIRFFSWTNTHSTMSSNNDSGASTQPPLKKIKVEHTSGGPSIRERAEVMVDEGAGATAGDDDDDGAILAALSAGAIVQDAAASVSEVPVKVEEGNEQAELAADLPEPVLSLNDGVEISAAAAAAARDDDDDQILAACSAGAIVQDAAARAREVSVKVEKGTEATEAELAAALPKPVLSLNDRVEIFWDGELEFFAGTVVRVKGKRIGIE